MYKNIKLKEKHLNSKIGYKKPGKSDITFFICKDIPENLYAEISLTHPEIFEETCKECNNNICDCTINDITNEGDILKTNLISPEPIKIQNNPINEKGNKLTK